jgi:ATP-dependent RNA helicase RhlB
MSDQPTKTESELSDDIAALDNARVADDQQPDATETETAETESVETETEETETEETESGAAETTANAAEARETPETSETVDAVEAITEAAEPETEQAEPVDDAVNAADAKTEAEHANESETHTDATAAPADVWIKFEELALPKPLLKAITKLGFEECTPIQGRSLPFSLSDYDVTGQAQTGTGKTAAFLITLLTRFWENPPQERPNLGTPRALVLAPTRELAMQIEGDSKGLAKYMDMRTVCVVGGMDFDRQRADLAKGPVDVLVATPGRLIDFLERRDINLSKVECLVIDEADRMLDMGFIPDVRRIVYQTPHKRKRQTLFFSATFNDAVMRLADSWTIDPEHIVVEPESVATDTVDQKFWLVEGSKRRRILLDFIHHVEPERAIIFANRRDRTHKLVEYLKKKGIPCEGLAGDVPQKKRLSTLNKFKSGELKYLVATDVAGRGIHVDGVTHVINYELPDDAEDYVHRIGRTGRAGASGTAISFVSEDDAFNLPALEEYLSASIKCIQPDLLPES